MNRPAGSTIRGLTPWFAVAMVWAAWALLLGCGRLHAAEAPPLRGHVNDYANVLGERAARIETMLAEHERASGNQVVVLTVTDLSGQDIDSYANEVFAQWRLGRKGVDDGVLIVVAVRDHRMRIEVGYGLEGSLTDLDSARIIRERMRPYFADGDYGAGVQSGVEGVLGVLGGDRSAAFAVKETPEQVIAREGWWKSGAGVTVILVALFCLLFAFLASQGGSLWALLLLLPLPLLVLLFLLHWWVVVLAYAVALWATLVWRRRNMQMEYRLGRRTRMRKCTVQAWPPTPWAVLTWSGSHSGGQAGGPGGTGRSGGGSGSSSSGYTGGGGSSGGGGASGSW